MECYKARLVAKSYNKCEGNDYGETYSLVVKPITTRVLLSLAIFGDFHNNEVDINNAFLHGDISDDVYMIQPPGFIHPFSHVMFVSFIIRRTVLSKHREHSSQSSVSIYSLLVSKVASQIHPFMFVSFIIRCTVLSKHREHSSQSSWFSRLDGNSLRIQHFFEALLGHSNILYSLAQTYHSQ